MSVTSRRSVMALQWCILVITLQSVFAQPQYSILGLYEGNNCRLPSGAQGVCSQLKDCPTELSRLRVRQNTRGNPVICSFSSSRPDAVPVVCCERKRNDIRETSGVTGNRFPGTPQGRPSGTPQGRPPGPAQQSRPSGTPQGRPFGNPQGRPPGPAQQSRPSGTLQGRPPGPTQGKPFASTQGRPLGTAQGRPSTTLQRRPSESAEPNWSLGTRLNTVGAKSKKACEDLSNEVRPSVIPLIIGGANTNKGEFPHMALIGYKSIDNNVILWNCGGALISKRYVLTAAHCIVTRARNHGPASRVRLGEYDLRRNNDGELDFGIEKSTPHPEYSANSWYNDIALVRLDKNVVYSSAILPACLYTENGDPQNGLIITGWGATSNSGDVKSNILQKGNRTLEMVPAEDCESTYFRQGARNRLSLGINPSMFCAVDPAGIVDTCQGDSGGPIQVEKDVGYGTIHVIVGVTSVGPSLCGGSTPAIYTRVYNYLGWIEATVDWS